MTDTDALRAHVVALASQPRHRAIADLRERAQAYVEAALRESGWQITHSDFRSAPSVLRTSDYGRQCWPAGAGGPISGRNVIAHRGNPEGATWVTAHLDSVHSSPGADDNASAVAIALELGRQLDRDDVAIVLTDHEESAMLGARSLSRSPRSTTGSSRIGSVPGIPVGMLRRMSMASRSSAGRVGVAGGRPQICTRSHPYARPRFLGDLGRAPVDRRGHLGVDVQLVLSAARHDQTGDAG